MSGYLFIALRAWNGVSQEEYENYMRSVTTDAEVIFSGPADRVYEMAALPNIPKHCAVLKFANLNTATSFALSKQFAATSTRRDVRALEAPPNLFTPGNAYWIAWIHRVLDKRKCDAYLTASMAQNEQGFGPAPVGQFEIGYVGGSNLFEEATGLVPKEGEGTDFFGSSTTEGIVAVLALGPHEFGRRLRDSLDYKNALLTAFDVKYTDGVQYDGYVKRFINEIFQRDLRIICI